MASETIPADNLGDDSQQWRRWVEESLKKQGKLSRNYGLHQRASDKQKDAFGRALREAGLSQAGLDAAVKDARRKPAAPANAQTTTDAYFAADGTPQSRVSMSTDVVTVDVNGKSINVANYQLYGRRNVAGTPWRMLAERESPVLVFDPLPIGEEWQFKVHAVSAAGVIGEASAALLVTMARDTTPPGKPAPMTATSRLGQVILSWNGKVEAGLANQPPDYSHSVVYVATSASAAGTAVGQIGTGGDTFYPPEVPYNQARWYFLVSYDKSGNASMPSSRVSIVTKPLVDTDIIGRVIDGASLKLDSINEELLSAPIKATLASADGKSTVYYQTTAPTGGTYKDGDTWFDTDDGNKLYRRTGSSWVAVPFGSTALASSVNDTINQASANASNAITAAGNAVTAANGKNSVTHSTATPSGSGSRNGDLWFRYSGAVVIGMWVWSGTAWVSRELDNAVIGSLDAGKINVGVLDAARIAAKSITVEQLVVASTGNMLPNGDFALGNSGWSTSSHMQVVRVTDGPGGATTNVARHTISSNDQVFYSTAFKPSATEGAEYVQGGSYNFRIVVRVISGTAGDVRVRLGFHGVGQGSQLPVVSGTSLSLASAVPGQWYELEGSHKTLTNNPRNRMSVSFHASGASGGVVEVAEFTARPMASSNLIVDGAVVARTIDAQAVTAEKLAVGAIKAGSAIIENGAISNAQIANLNAGKITAGTLDAERIGAKTIAVEKLVVTNFTNLVPDPALLGDLSNVWGTTSGATWSMEIAATSNSAIGKMIKVTLNNAGGETKLASMFTALPGEKYNVSVRTQNGTGGTSTARFGIRWFNKDGATITTSLFAEPSTSWGTFGGVVEAPAGAVQGAAALSWTAGATGALHFADMSIIRMTSTELLVDGAVISRTIATDAVVARTIAADQIEAGHIKSNAITSDKINAGAITAVKIAGNSITGDKIAANTITADKIIVGDFTNLISDPDFTSIGGSWTFGNVDQAPFLSQVTTSSSVASGKSLRLAKGHSADVHIFSNVTTCESGDQYLLKFQAANQTDANVRCAIYWSDKDDSYLSRSVFDITPGAAWGTYSQVYMAPAGAKFMRANFYLKAPNTSGYAYIHRPQLLRMTQAELIVNGSITGDKIEANAINGKTITGALIRSAASGARTEMTNQGLQTLDAAGNPLVRIGYGIPTGMQVRNPAGGALVPLGPHVFGTQGYTNTTNLNVTAGSAGNWGAYTDENLGPTTGVVSSPTGRMLVFAQVNLSYNSALDTEFQIVADLSSPSGSVRFINNVPLYGGAMTHVAIVNVVAGRTYRPFFAIRGRSGTSGRVSTFVLRTMVAMPI